ncbi:hypothetical protein [Pseudobacteroides cellulosolvens]|uniref:YesK-like protein n=1 Tax=Pseudobacteroides cellulosolvens ATCC 35603 = DSM 2933 TaxID=398512 RepID=A0A0L6JL35_9FIRM|nr:hypothetical protein [Pseudobacteroides cellulosolvens]KNY26489.1 hypothetical protein Bccel_1754 [Pseudobacteroides cellulosolvens ATCC 35603 = DSM 2933]
MVQFTLLLYITIIGIVFSGIALLIYKFERNRPLPKYLPGIILFLAGVILIIKAKWFSEGMEGLGYIILAILAIGGSIIALIVPAVLDVYKKYHQ